MFKFLERIDPNPLAIISLVGFGFLILIWISGRQTLATECLQHYPPDSCLEFFQSFWF